MKKWQTATGGFDLYRLFTLEQSFSETLGQPESKWHTDKPLLDEPLDAAVKVGFLHRAANPADDAPIFVDEDSKWRTDKLVGLSDLHLRIQTRGKSDPMLSDKFFCTGFSVFDEDTHKLHPFGFYFFVDFGYGRSLLPAFRSPRSHKFEHDRSSLKIGKADFPFVKGF